MRLNKNSRQAIFSSIKEKYMQDFAKLHNLSVINGILNIDKLKDLERKKIAKFIKHRLFDKLEFTKQQEKALNLSKSYLYLIDIDNQSSNTFCAHTLSFPCTKEYKSVLVSSKKYKEETDRFFKLERLGTELTEKLQVLRLETMQVLESVNTKKQLLELWPDIEQYIPAHLASPSASSNLPTLTISRLQERINENAEL